MQIPLPIEEPSYLGNIVADFIKLLGLALSSPCEPCKKRQEQLNQAVQLVPWDYYGTRKY